MLRRILTAALAVSALAMTAPVAQASFPIAFDCRAAVVADEAVTGNADTFTGFAVGFVVSREPIEAVSIRCYISVDGSEVATTTTGSGTAVATTAGQVTYTANPSQTVRVCAAWTAGPDASTQCFGLTAIRTDLPRSVIDATVDFLNTIARILGVLPVVCPILVALAPGIPAVVDIDFDGDTTVLAIQLVDCPPFDS